MLPKFRLAEADPLAVFVFVIAGLAGTIACIPIVVLTIILLKSSKRPLDRESVRAHPLFRWMAMSLFALIGCLVVLTGLFFLISM